MRIAMFTNTYLPHVGGVARSIVRFSDAFRAAGHRVLIVAPEFEAQPECEQDVIRVPALTDFNHTGFSFALPSPPAAMRAVREFRPDIVHSHHPFLLGDAALRAKAAANVPIVMTYHTMYERFVHYLPIELNRMAEIAVTLATDYANECDHVVAPTASIRDLLITRGVETPITVIPTGVDVRHLAAGDGIRARQRLQIPENAFVIGHVGRLAPEKNLAYLAGEVARVLCRIDNTIFVAVGDGSERAAMERILHQVVPANRVRFTGLLEGESLADMYHAMNVFVFASTCDTQGLVLAEAMACSVPVVGLDAAGTHDIVRDGENGVLVRSETAGELAAALISLARMDAQRRRRMSEAALVTARDWSTERCADRCLRVYDDAISAEVRKPSRVSEAPRLLRVIAELSRLWGRRIVAGARILLHS